MRSSLAIIEQAVATALEQPAGETKTRYVAGFPVEHVTQPHRQWNDHRSTFRQDAERLHATLMAQGVEPIAILPKAWWRAMVERAHLIDLAPDADGQVLLNPDEVAKKATNGWIFATIAGGVTAVVASVSYYTLVVQPGFDPFYLPRIVAFLALSAVVSALVTGILGAMFTKTSAWLEAQVGSTLWMLTHRRADVIREMQESGGQHVRVYLPTPPDSVVEVLRRCAGMMNLRVAAVSGAVGFSPSPRALIAAQMMKTKIEAVERSRVMRQLDPIVYAQSGSAVAIVAQFGAFPIEQKLVEEIVRTGNLLA